MQFETEAIVCGLRAHGEHGSIVRLMTFDHGLVAAYVRGGRGRRMRPILIPGNVVAAQLRSRTEAQLPQATIELAHSRAPLLAEPLPAAAIDWISALVAAALPERQPYPRLYEALGGLLDAVESAPSATGWAGALARFETFLVAQLGYGRDEAGAPAWLRRGGTAGWREIFDALDLSGAVLFREILTGRSRALQDSRNRLLERMRRMAS
ncbi:MAG TPA: recombination protein O N-terminal domain-containing protein [Sphingomicrobium sp.]|nr:recombination protein O N-terminal domain-containing protein [Sphingomicrobium sp.]